MKKAGFIIAIAGALLLVGCTDTKLDYYSSNRNGIISIGNNKYIKAINVNTGYSTDHVYIYTDANGNPFGEGAVSNSESKGKTVDYHAVIPTNDDAQGSASKRYNISCDTMQECSNTIELLKKAGVK
jgi:hypothetical protein